MSLAQSGGVRRVLAGAAVLCVGCGLAGAAAAQVTITTYALTGDMAPDGDGTFQTFGTPTINANGDVAFAATIQGTSNPTGVFLADGATISQLVRNGDATPTMNGTFLVFNDISSTETVAINDSGEVAFSARLAGTSGGLSDNKGLFGAAVGSPILEYVRLGDSAPDMNGTLLGLSPPGIDANGDATFHGFFTGTSGGGGVDDNGAFRSDGTTVTRLARAGTVEPGGNGTFQQIEFQLASNLAGDVAFDSFLTGTMGGVGVDDDRLYVSQMGVVSLFTSSGLGVPGGAGTVTGLGLPEIAESGHVALIAQFSGTPGGLEDDQAILLSTGMATSILVRESDPAPNGAGGSNGIFDSFSQLDFNARDEVAFIAGLESTSGGVDDDGGIFVASGGGVRQVVREGDAAPDGNGNFSTIPGALLLNDIGDVVVMAFLAGTAAPGSDDLGIYLVDEMGTAVKVARIGDPLEGSTITDLYLLGGPTASAEMELAGVEGLNDARQVAFAATLMDGRSGVFVPEPGAAGAAATALAVLAGLTRRRA